MAFPSVAVLTDDFNRADAPNLGPNWISGVIDANTGTGSPEGSFSIVSNTAFSPGGGGSQRSNCWRTASYSDCEVYTSLPGALIDGSIVSVLARITNPGASVNGYRARNNVNAAAPDSLLLQRYDSVVATQLGSTLTMATDLVANDKLGIECAGSAINVYTYQAGAWGTALISQTDSIYGVGYGGIKSTSAVAGAGAFDDFFIGGTLQEIPSNAIVPNYINFPKRILARS